MKAELAQVIADVRSGNAEAYRTIIAKFQGMAVGYASALLGDFHLAQDAAQEAFVEAYRSLHRLENPAAFGGFLRRIVQRRCSHMTRGKRVVTVGIKNAEGMYANSLPPSEIVLQRETDAAVRSAIASLPEPQREVTLLFYLGGCGHQQIAAFLDLPLGTVKHQLYLARQNLKQGMLHMVEKNLRSHAPRDAFNQQVFARMFRAGLTLAQGLKRPTRSFGSCGRRRMQRQVWVSCLTAEARSTRSKNCARPTKACAIAFTISIM